MTCIGNQERVEISNTDFVNLSLHAHHSILFKHIIVYYYIHNQIHIIIN